MKRLIVTIIGYLIVFVAIPPEVLRAAGQGAGDRAARIEFDPTAEVQHGVLHEAATGKILDVTHYIGKRGHSAVVTYTDANGATATIFIDRSGRVTSDLGVSFSSDVMTAVWQGQTVPRSGVATFRYSSPGGSGETKVTYDADARSARAGLLAQPMGVPGLSDFLQNLSTSIEARREQVREAALPVFVGFNASFDRVGGDGQSKIRALNEWSFIDIFICILEMILFVIAAAAVVITCTASVGFGCAAAVFVFIASGVTDMWACSLLGR